MRREASDGTRYVYQTPRDDGWWIDLHDVQQNNMIVNAGDIKLKQAIKKKKGRVMSLTSERQFGCLCRNFNKNEAARKDVIRVEWRDTPGRFGVIWGLGRNMHTSVMKWKTSCLWIKTRVMLISWGLGSSYQERQRKSQRKKERKTPAEGKHRTRDEPFSAT